MNILETDHWCMMLPEEWHAENDDDVIRIVDQDDVGEIEITTLHKQSGRVNASDVAAMASEESPEITEWHQARAGGFEGVTGVYREDGASVREWYLGSESLLLYIPTSALKRTKVSMMPQWMSSWGPWWSGIPRPLRRSRL